MATGTRASSLGRSSAASPLRIMEPRAERDPERRLCRAGAEDRVDRPRALASLHPALR